MPKSGGNPRVAPRVPRNNNPNGSISCGVPAPVSSPPFLPKVVVVVAVEEELEAEDPVWSRQSRRPWMWWSRTVSRFGPPPFSVIDPRLILATNGRFRPSHRLLRHSCPILGQRPVFSPVSSRSWARPERPLWVCRPALDPGVCTCHFKDVSNRLHCLREKRLAIFSTPCRSLQLTRATPWTNWSPRNALWPRQNPQGPPGPLHRAHWVPDIAMCCLVSRNRPRYAQNPHPKSRWREDSCRLRAERARSQKESTPCPFIMGCKRSCPWPNRLPRPRVSCPKNLELQLNPCTVPPIRLIIARIVRCTSSIRQLSNLLLIWSKCWLGAVQTRSIRIIILTLTTTAICQIHTSYYRCPWGPRPVQAFPSDIKTRSEQTHLWYKPKRKRRSFWGDIG